MRWYRREANQGHPRGQANLGFMYAEGRGVREDVAYAIRLYRLAAAQADENRAAADWARVELQRLGAD